LAKHINHKEVKKRGIDYRNRKHYNQKVVYPFNRKEAKMRVPNKPIISRHERSFVNN
jgi:hypothetical protein